MYESKREGNRVRSKYVGRGMVANLVAELNQLRAEYRRDLAAAAKLDLEFFHTDEASIGFGDYFTKIQTFAHALMVIAGFHRHDRGAWRKKRMASELAVAEPVASPAQRLEEFDRRFPHEAIVDAVVKAAQGDESVAGTLRQIMVHDPSELIPRFMGWDLVARIEETIVARASGKDIAAREALKLRIETIRKEMAGPEPSPSEKLLAERIALSWANLHRLELDLIQNGTQMAPVVREALSREIDRAHRMYITGIKTLAVVRRLALPAIQVNLAENQIVQAPAKKSRRKAAPQSDPQGQLADR